MKYAGLAVKRIIMHEILRGVARDAEPQLSDVPTDTPEADRLFIQERIRKTLPKDARPIVEEPGLSAAPAQIRAYLQATDPDIVSASQILVKCLQGSQSPVSPGGIFVFAEAALDKKPAVLIAKLEHQEGVRATPTKLSTGEITFGVELLKDLLFTTGSRVYKVALFVGEEIENDILHGVVVDRQMAGSSLAQFFLTTFLGCQLAERADLLTERFYNGTQSYINGITDPEKKARYEVALLSEMQSQGETLSFLEFASHHLDVEDRDEFAHSLRGSGVPARTFTKDNKLIRNKISKIKLNTEAGVTVLAPPETLDNGVLSVEGSLNDDSAVITVRDRLASFK
jgi:hypothetical protein